MQLEFSISVGVHPNEYCNHCHSHCRELVKVDGFDNLPIFLGGISLGGCIVLSAALQEVG